MEKVLYGHVTGNFTDSALGVHIIFLLSGLNALRRGDNLAENCTDTLSLQNGQPENGSLKLAEQREFLEMEHWPLIRLLVTSFKLRIAETTKLNNYVILCMVFSYNFFFTQYYTSLVVTRPFSPCIIT